MPDISDPPSPGSAPSHPDTKLGAVLKFRAPRPMAAALKQRAAERSKDLGRELTMSSIIRELVDRGLRGEEPSVAYESAYREGFAAGVHEHAKAVAQRTKAAVGCLEGTKTEPPGGTKPADGPTPAAADRSTPEG